MAFTSFPLQVQGSLLKPFIPDSPKASPRSSSLKVFFNELRQLPMKIDVSKAVTSTSRIILEKFVESTFQFVDQPLLPSQSNFAPVEEIGEAVEVTCSGGDIPTDFPEGVYVRNGPNPLFGGRKAAVSVFGESRQVWVEGEGMLHALYFKKNAAARGGNWTISYKNKYVESESFKLETQRNRPLFLPTVEGDPPAVIAAALLNQWRYNMNTKHYQNVSVVEHSGKLFTATEDYLAREFDLHTLETLDDWDCNGAWTRAFTSHPKKVPSGELVTMGFNGNKPYLEVGVISADGKKLLHKADLKFERATLSHDIGVTQNYNVIIDHPLIIDFTRLFKGGTLIKYEKERDARIGVMPRYGDADSVKWFKVEPNCTFHIINCFEDGDEVIVRGCRAGAAIVPGPDPGEDKFDWFSRGFTFPDSNNKDHYDGSKEYGHLLHRVHEWRLNMATREVKEKYLTGTDFSMDFPMIHGGFTGLNHKYGYAQVIDSVASSEAGYSKYGGLAKLYFNEEQSTVPERKGSDEAERAIKTEYHKFPEDTFCTGSTFVPKEGGVDEDDGWVITFVHNEKTNVSQAYVGDAKKFQDEPVALITLPQTVPYGHHGLFVPTALSTTMS